MLLAVAKGFNGPLLADVIERGEGLILTFAKFGYCPLLVSCIDVY